MHTIRKMTHIFHISSRKNAGFTLLELILVMLLITLILSFSTVFFASRLPASTFRATVRELDTTIRHARTLSKSEGEIQKVIVDLDAKRYGIEGKKERKIPSDVDIKVIDPLSEEIVDGKYEFLFYPFGGFEGGTIVLQYGEKVITLEPDPVVGTVVIK